MVGAPTCFRGVYIYSTKHLNFHNLECDWKRHISVLVQHQALSAVDNAEDQDLGGVIQDLVRLNVYGKDGRSAKHSGSISFPAQRKTGIVLPGDSAVRCDSHPGVHPTLEQGRVSRFCGIP
jgi:hypothetical protein